MENKHNRLVSERFGSSSERFENMLITTRRAPLLSGYGAAALQHAVTAIAPAAVRNSFFSKPYSTKAEAHTRPKYTLLMARAALLRKAAVSSRSEVAPYKEARVSQAMKRLAVARANSRELLGASATQVGTIDPRITRLKSPRSADYILRKPTVKSNPTPNFIVQNLENRPKTETLKRQSRARLSIFDALAAKSDETTKKYVVKKVKRELLKRKVVVMLKQREVRSKKTEKKQKKRRLFLEDP
jgi:hypothetical protein